MANIFKGYCQKHKWDIMTQETNINGNNEEEAIVKLSIKGKSVSYGNNETMMYDLHLKDKSDFDKYFLQYKEIIAIAKSKITDKAMIYLNGKEGANCTNEDLMKEAILLYNDLINEIKTGIKNKT
jgi:hypothetical protein